MFLKDTAREILRAAPGVTISDDRAANRFPTPLEVIGQFDFLKMDIFGPAISLFLFIHIPPMRFLVVSKTGDLLFTNNMRTPPFCGAALAYTC